MIQYKTCGICGLEVVHKDFLIDPETLSPKYYAAVLFNPDLDTEVVFCSAAHSLQWHQKRQIDKETGNP